MLESADASDDLTRDAIFWFGESLGPDEWINETWIGHLGVAEMRMVDIVCADLTHRLLCRLAPSDDPISRWDNLDYEGLQDSVDEIKEMAARHGFVIWDFAGPATSVPWAT